ncbi:hypothetical protein [Pseudactinotalea sp. Z1748]|uniref:hypothetical protein n=1 Tax=Pseudactinotalea sp. Z1748 TaxID=3413027 RepID=UPI003C7E9398
MARVFNPPPGWPKPEEGWTPPPGWKPDPSWPEPPQGWDFWLEKADDVGSSLFGSSALSSGSSLFETSDTVASYGSVSPSGEAHIPGAPRGPDFHVSNREPRSASDGVSQSSAGAPASPSSASPGPGGSAGGSPYTAGASTPSGVRAGATYGQSGPTVSTHSGSSTPGGNPNAAPPVGPQGGGKTVLLGLVLVLVGIGVTGYSYFSAMPGEEFRLLWVPVVFGLILMIQGAVRMARARAKRQQLGTVSTGYNPGGHLTQPGGGGDASGGLQTGHSSTVPMQNPTDPKGYKNR